MVQEIIKHGMHILIKIDIRDGSKLLESSFNLLVNRTMSLNFLEMQQGGLLTSQILLLLPVK